MDRQKKTQTEQKKGGEKKELNKEALKNVTGGLEGLELWLPGRK